MQPQRYSRAQTAVDTANSSITIHCAIKGEVIHVSRNGTVAQMQNSIFGILKNGRIAAIGPCRSKQLWWWFGPLAKIVSWEDKAYRFLG